MMKLFCANTQQLFAKTSIIDVWPCQHRFKGEEGRGESSGDKPMKVKIYQNVQKGI